MKYINQAFVPSRGLEFTFRLSYEIKDGHIKNAYPNYKNVTGNFSSPNGEFLELDLSVAYDEKD